jgi:hypothetical protein
VTRGRYRSGEDDYPHFLTCTVVGWLPVFTRPETVQIIYDSWRFLQTEGRLTLYGYVILENHLHLIAASPDLTKEMGDFKSFTARRIIDHLQAKGATQLLKLLHLLKARHKVDREYQLWQEGSHPQQMLNEQIMHQKVGVHAPQPARARVGRRSDPLAAFERPQLRRDGGTVPGRDGLVLRSSRSGTRSVPARVPTQSVGTREMEGGDPVDKRVVAEPALTLLVLKTARPEEVRSFYESFGISFNEERHGDGPLHYAAKMGPLVFEVYPLPVGTSEADHTTRLGFAVTDLAGVLEALQARGFPLPGLPRETPWGRVVTVRDPDARAVELSAK